MLKSKHMSVMGTSYVYNQLKNSETEQELMNYHTSPSYSLTIRMSIDRKPGMLGTITSAIGKKGGLIGAISIRNMERGRIIRDVNVYAQSEEHQQAIMDSLGAIAGVKVLSVKDRTFEYHEGGKFQVQPIRDLNDPDDLALAYTPGVGRISMAVAKDLAKAYRYTMKGNSVAVVTDGTAVLGLGDIGPIGALPVMEGKAVLFKRFAGINAVPICLSVTDPDSIVSVVKAISPAFGGINLEDISAPRCFEVEDRLKQELDIPVFHDDQHGTAIAVLAALSNALSLVGKRLNEARIVVSGAGAAGVACIKILLDGGAANVVVCDRKGAIYKGRRHDMNPIKEHLAEIVNADNERGSLKKVLKGADVFIGVSVGDLLAPADLKVMAKDPIVFALANPIPEVDPEGAQHYTRVIATGRSDFPNQINNVLVFPGVFRGALDARARTINAAMKLTAAMAIASLVPPEELSEDYIVPGPFHERVCQTVAEAVSRAASRSGAA
jgi:malate dehydrogenase (oxaloacetate-decarboxylating)